MLSGSPDLIALHQQELTAGDSYEEVVLALSVMLLLA
jgi:hypothetical protein